MMQDPANKVLSSVAAPGFFVLAFLAPRTSLACAACFGQDSGPMAQGMNWGIFSLLGIIVSVLVGVAGFFVYLARRSVTADTPAAVRRSAPATASSELASGQAHSGKVTAVFKPGEPRPQTA